MRLPLRRLLDAGIGVRLQLKDTAVGLALHSSDARVRLSRRLLDAGIGVRLQLKDTALGLALHSSDARVRLSRRLLDAGVGVRPQFGDFFGLRPQPLDEPVGLALELVDPRLGLSQLGRQRAREGRGAVAIFGSIGLLPAAALPLRQGLPEPNWAPREGVRLWVITARSGWAMSPLSSDARVRLSRRLLAAGVGVRPQFGDFFGLRPQPLDEPVGLALELVDPRLGLSQLGRQRAREGRGAVAVRSIGLLPAAALPLRQGLPEPNWAPREGSVVGS